MTATIAMQRDILLVEDNAADVRLTQRALAETKVGSRLNVVRNGVDAMQFLLRLNHFADAPRPDLILLDLNLPQRSGHEVLADIKFDPDLRQIPVIVLSTSQAEADVRKSYELHANSFITKPSDLESFFHIIRSLEAYWFQIVTLSPA